jgi:uncharacterized protein YceH (UPF0502 family)
VLRQIPPVDSTSAPSGDSTGDHGDTAATRRGDTLPITLASRFPMTTSEPSTPSGVTPELDPVEARVLACLIEKEATTPEQYPLTANAVQVACNQKTAREPVLELEPGAVGHALRTLEDKRIVRVIHGSRALRYDHRMDDVYAISPEQRIVLTLLILRGPQTAGELLARSERMHRFPDVDHLKTLLERLATRSPAMVIRLSRGGGQREDRYAHLLSGTIAIPVAPASGPVPPSNAPDASAHLSTHLDDRVGRLEREVEDLRAQLAELKRDAAENS